MQDQGGRYDEGHRTLRFTLIVVLQQHREPGISECLTHGVLIWPYIAWSDPIEDSWCSHMVLTQGMSSAVTFLQCSYIISIQHAFGFIVCHWYTIIWGKTTHPWHDIDTLILLFFCMRIIGQGCFLFLPQSGFSSSSGRDLSARHSWCSAISLARVKSMQWVTLAGLQDMWNTGISPRETGLLEFDLRQTGALCNHTYKNDCRARPKRQDLQKWTLAKKWDWYIMVSIKKKTLWGPAETVGRHWVRPVDPRCERSYLLPCANLQRSPFAFSTRPDFLLSPPPPSHILTSMSDMAYPYAQWKNATTDSYSWNISVFN